MEGRKILLRIKCFQLERRENWEYSSGAARPLFRGKIFDPSDSIIQGYRFISSDYLLVSLWRNLG